MTEPDETTDTEETAEEFDARARLAFGLDAPGNGPALEAAPPGARMHPRRVSLPALPSYFGHATPDAVLAAHAALVAAADRVNELVDQIDAVPRRIADAHGAYLRDVARAELDGTAAPKAPKATEDPNELEVLRTRWAVRSRAFSAARKEFSAALSGSSIEWLAAVIALQEPARDAARKALAPESKVNVHEAARLAADWWGMLAAADALWKTLNPQGRPPARQGIGTRALSAVIGDCLAILDDDAEELDHRWMTSDMTPPFHERRALSRSGSAAELELFRIEAAEGWSLTSFTQHLKLLYGYGESVVTPSGVRYVR